MWTLESPPRLLNPERITIGKSTSVVVELRCSSANESESGSNVRWVFAGNGTDVASPLAAYGTSQGGGVLRVSPSYLLLTNGTVFLCVDEKRDDVLKVNLELRKLVVHTVSVYFWIPVI